MFTTSSTTYAPKSENLGGNIVGEPTTVPLAVDDMAREFAKLDEVLKACEMHLAHHAAANAALHCAETVMYSPLHARVTAARLGISGVINRLGAAEVSVVPAQ